MRDTKKLVKKPVAVDYLPSFSWRRVSTEVLNKGITICWMPYLLCNRQTRCTHNKLSIKIYPCIRHHYRRARIAKSKAAVGSY